MNAIPLLLLSSLYFRSWAFYSIIKQRGKCSRRYSNSSCDAPGQFVSSNSCRWRNWIILDKPLDVNSGQPAGIKRTLRNYCNYWKQFPSKKVNMSNQYESIQRRQFEWKISSKKGTGVVRVLPAKESICRFRIEQRCCKPKSRTCEHQRKNSAVNDSIVDI